MKICFLLFGIMFWVNSCSVFQKPYSMQRCENHFYAEITKNELIGISDTVVVNIRGFVTNFISPGNGILLNFNSKDTKNNYVAKTDSIGTYSIFLKSGKYNLSINNNNIDSLQFKSGEIRNIDVYMESLRESVVYKFKNKRAYKKYINNQKNKY